MKEEVRDKTLSERARVRETERQRDTETETERERERERRDSQAYRHICLSAFYTHIFK